MKKVSAAASWRRAKTSNGKSPNGSSAEAFHDIERLIARKQWAKARRAIQELLVFHPADHWLWMHLGATYYEQKKYDRALKCAEHAVHLDPDCPLAMWHYAAALYMTGRTSAAVWLLDRRWRRQERERNKRTKHRDDDMPNPRSMDL